MKYLCWTPKHSERDGNKVPVKDQNIHHSLMNERGGSRKNVKQHTGTA